MNASNRKYWDDLLQQSGITQRNNELYAEYLSGVTKSALSRKHSISRERVAQIIKRQETKLENGGGENLLELEQ